MCVLFFLPIADPLFVYNLAISNVLTPVTLPITPGRTVKVSPSVTVITGGFSKPYRRAKMEK